MKKSIVTIACAFAIILFAVAGKNLYSCEIPIHNRGIRDAIATGDLDVLLIGSSTFRCNIDMREMDETFQGRAYDISYGGNQLAAASIQYDELKRRSKNHYGLMVFELGPMMLTEDIAISDSRVIWDLSFEGKKALWKKMKEGGNAGLPLTFEYFVTSGMDDLLTFPVTEPFYATRYYKGVKTEAAPSPGRAVLENESFDLSDARPVEAQIDALKEIIEKCRADGQPFVFVESPVYHRLEEDPAYRKYRKEFIRILKESGADFILAKDVGFDCHEASYFEDMNHMSEEGRKLYTRLLAPLLSKRL